VQARTLLVFFVLPALLGTSCESVVGIKDYTLETCDAACQSCQSFCATVDANCTLENQVYKDQAQCNGVCKWLPPGDANESSAEQNTVACRADAAKNAGLETDPEKQTADCQAASPGGGNQCPTGNTGNCEVYCNLLQNVCPNDVLPVDCLTSCQGLRVDPGNYNLDTNYTGDSVQCRLVHLSAATVDPTTHCPHVNFFPFTDPTYPCQDPDDGKHPPTCEDFCQLTTQVCGGDFAVYESKPQCLAVCNLKNPTLGAGVDTQFRPGLNDEEANNTIGCRRWHAYKSSDTDTTKLVHCPHTGPGGGMFGHCQDDPTLAECEPFCQLSASVCPRSFAKAFPGDVTASQEACQAACVPLLPSNPTTDVYSVKAAKNDPTSLWGRILLASELAEDIKPGTTPDESNCDGVVIAP
jgi:hypothetical protein